MKRRTIKEAVVELLKKEGKPLSAKEIYVKIVESDLYRFNAEKPENIVQVEIRRHCEGLEFPTARPNKLFQLLKNGTYWLKGYDVPGSTNAEKQEIVKQRKNNEDFKLIVHELKEVHNRHTKLVKAQILNQLKKIEPDSFEHFSGKLLKVYGFKNVEVTKKSKDGGIDGFGELKVGISHLNVAFQCKRWKSNSVGRTEIDKFRGAIQGEYEQGIFITTSSFSKDALKATRKNGAVPIILIDGEALVDIMIEKKFGVETENIPVIINAIDSVFNDD